MRAHYSANRFSVVRKNGIQISFSFFGFLWYYERIWISCFVSDFVTYMIGKRIWISFFFIFRFPMLLKNDVNFFFIFSFKYLNVLFGR